MGICLLKSIMQENNPLSSEHLAVSYRKLAFWDICIPESLERRYSNTKNPVSLSLLHEKSFFSATETGFFSPTSEYWTDALERRYSNSTQPGFFWLANTKNRFFPRQKPVFFTQQVNTVPML
jgi:hypothetical protein